MDISESETEINEFRDKLSKGNLSRRQVIKMVASVGVCAAVMPVLPKGLSAASEDHPLLFGWAGYEDPNFWGPYVAKYGEPPRTTFWGDQDEALAKMRAGFTPDMMQPCYSVHRLWYDAGLFAPVDTKLLSNWPDVLKPLKRLPGAVIDGKRYFVPGDWGQTSVLFRGDLAPEYLDPRNHTWGILWDPKYKGRVAVFDSVADTVVAAAVYAGIDPFTMEQGEIEQVRALLKELIPNLRFLSMDTTSMSQAVASGEVIATMAWNETIWKVNEFSNKDPAAQFVWMKPREGALTWVCGLAIHPQAQESGMYERCHEAIDAFLSPESGYFELTEWNYGVANRKVYDMVDEEFLESIGLAKDIEAFLADGVFIRPIRNRDKLARMLEDVKAGF